MKLKRDYFRLLVLPGMRRRRRLQQNLYFPHLYNSIAYTRETRSHCAAATGYIAIKSQLWHLLRSGQAPGLRGQEAHRNKLVQAIRKLNFFVYCSVFFPPETYQVEVVVLSHFPGVEQRLKRDYQGTNLLNTN